MEEADISPVQYAALYQVICFCCNMERKRREMTTKSQAMRNKDVA
jgi:hypothetical protein